VIFLTLKLQPSSCAMRDAIAFMMEHLRTTPYLPMKKLVFKMKHIDVFEYRLPNYNRAYYIIHKQLRLVFVYYIGEHPKDNIPEITKRQLSLMQDKIEAKQKKDTKSP